MGWILVRHPLYPLVDEKSVFAVYRVGEAVSIQDVEFR